MENKARNKSTKEEEDKLKRFYHVLMQEGNIRPDLIYRYLPNRDCLITDVGLGMSFIRQEEGVAGLKAYMAWLSRKTGPEYKRLIKILLDIELKNDAGTLLSDVQPQKMPWLWYPRLALGKITMLDGDPGLGKSLIGADIGARITKGAKMPDGTPCLATGGVVVIMPEDTLQDTILPRFARAGADLSKVVDLSTVQAEDDDGEEEYEYVYIGKDENAGEVSRRLFRLQSDLAYLEAAIRRVDAKLVYIDPIMALAGGTNMSNDDDVRTLLLPLKMLIERLQVACVMVRHLTKTRGGNPLMAGSGSIAFIGLARTGLMVAQNPTDKSQVILSHIKSNVGPLASDMKYAICSDETAGDERPYVVWVNAIQASESDPITTPHQTTRK
jgi:hypothetical protein